LFLVDGSKTDAVWLVFFIPAAIMLFWALVDLFLIKDTPDQAGFDEFDPADASSDDGEIEFTMGQLLKKIFTSPVLLTVALVEFTSGVLRNGIMQWYLIFAKEMPNASLPFLVKNWGLVMMVTGIVGGFVAGMLSDKIFHSRRGPPATLLNILMFICMTGMAYYLTASPEAVAVFIGFHALAVIGVHSIMSGTAAADFGGRKATATASGITDACVYLGSGVQSMALGYLTTSSWHYWPLFLIPFTILGVIISSRMWKQLPEATKRYLVAVERVSIQTVTVVVETEGQS
jgi:OPA family glycerol-3-phosphate transporter-like MFS transporter